MNRISIDIFAETNPAFCSLVLLKYCEGYLNEANEGVPFPLILLPLPIVLSKDLSVSFERTNINTGFFRWIENNPEILINLTERIEGSFEFIKPAIEFGFYKNILKLNEYGYLCPSSKNIKKINKTNLVHYYKYAERLGSWIAQIKSVKTIFNHLGIQI